MLVFSAPLSQLTVFCLIQSSGIETLVEELCCRLKDLQSEQGECAGAEPLQPCRVLLSAVCVSKLAFLITLSSARGFSEVVSGHMGNPCSQRWAASTGALSNMKEPLSSLSGLGRPTCQAHSITWVPKCSLCRTSGRGCI